MTAWNLTKRLSRALLILLQKRVQILQNKMIASLNQELAAFKAQYPPAQDAALTNNDHCARVDVEEEVRTNSDEYYN